MKCPVCDNPKSRVVDSRKPEPTDPDADAVVLRSRSCPNCGTRWATREVFSHLTRIEGTSTRPDRIRSGELHNIKPRTKLTPEQVVDVRGSKEDAAVTAKRVSVTPGHVRAIRSGRRR